MTEKELAGDGPADGILKYYRNTHVPGRHTHYPLWTTEIVWGDVNSKPHHPANYGIIVEYIKGAQIWTAPSTHGSSHSYDREVPLIFMGTGITPGISNEPARTIDLAPTLAILSGVDYPITVEGKVLIIPI